MPSQMRGHCLHLEIFKCYGPRAGGEEEKAKHFIRTILIINVPRWPNLKIPGDKTEKLFILSLFYSENKNF